MIAFWKQWSLLSSYLPSPWLWRDALIDAGSVCLLMFTIVFDTGHWNKTTNGASETNHKECWSQCRSLTHTSNEFVVVGCVSISKQLVYFAGKGSLTFIRRIQNEILSWLDAFPSIRRIQNEIHTIRAILLTLSKDLDVHKATMNVLT